MSVRTETGGPVMFDGDYRLEGILEWPTQGVDQFDPVTGARTSAPDHWSRVRGGVVIAHPHPLYGGTMAQPLVHRIAQACRSRGLATLRFNFRGVGRSGGIYSGSDEYRDVEAAAVYLRAQLAGLDDSGQSERQRRPLALAGYSFGSFMAATGVNGTVPAEALALVAFAVEWEELPSGMLERFAAFGGPVLAVCGEYDELAPPEEVRRVLLNLKLDFSLSIIEGTDHFFEGLHRRVGEDVATFFDRVFPEREPRRTDHQKGAATE